MFTRYGFIIFTLLSLLATNLKAQCPDGTADTNIELVVNGDFEQGNVGFSSEYTYVDCQNCLYPEAYYAVGTDPNYYHDAFYGYDHTTGTGNFMIVNGAGTVGVSVWCQTVYVEPNTLYLFSTWLASMVTSNPANLQFSINGVVIGTEFIAPSSLYTWLQFSASWYSGADTVAVICIVNQDTNLGGNDFGLDDISFQPCTCVFQTSATSNSPVCPGEVALLTAASGGTGTIYQWSPSTGLGCSSCQVTPTTVSAATTYTLIASINNCSDTATVEVTLGQSPTANAGNDTSVCEGEQIQLQGSGGTQYVWNPGTGLSNQFIASPTATVNQTITYTLLVVNADGCAGEDEMVVTVFPQNDLVVSSDTTVCVGENVLLSASPGSSFTWNPSDGLNNSNISNPIATVTNNITYTVTGINSNGCEDTATIQLSIFNPEPIIVSSDTTVCNSESITLTALYGSNFNWSGPDGSCNNCNDLVITVTQSGVYQVVGKDVNGCDAIADVAVIVNNGCAFINFPSAFTPNGDGLNDLFKPFLKSIVSLEYRIYNRWGQLMFTSHDMNLGWDGMFNDKEQPVGSYAYIAIATTNLGNEITLQGNLTLLR